MIRFGALVDELRRLGEECPDKQTKAQYFEGGKPCCIVGHAFVNLDTDIIDQGSGYDESASLLTRHGAVVAHSADIITDADFDWAAAGFRKPTVKQLAWVGAVQAGADHGWPWGYSTEQADKGRKVSV